MFRTAILSIVVIIIAAHNAWSLCTVPCDLFQVATHQCENNAATPIARITAGRVCNQTMVSPAAFLREDRRVGVNASDHHALGTPRIQFAVAVPVQRPDCRPAQAFPVHEPPVLLALRI
jgi:hypothetical protein